MDFLIFDSILLPGERAMLNAGRICCSLFFAVLFLQSGFDKVFNFSSNASYFREHFKGSPFATSVKPLLIILTILEVCSGFLILAGVIDFFISGSYFLIFYGLLLSLITLVCLFTGQRLAKDYAGASSIAIYFSAAILTLILLT